MDTKKLAVVGLLSFALVLIGCPNNRLRDIDNCTMEARNGQRESCWTGDAGSPGVGECRNGYYVCVDGVKDRSTCVGEITPLPEICDGKDNDCNGKIDDVTPESDPLIGKACGEDFVSPSQASNGPCRLGKNVCRSGTVICDGLVRPEPERCDHLDNDCSGFADDGKDLYETCKSSGNPVGVGVCWPGLRKCGMNGAADAGECFGEVKPSTEICDGKDHDCDGVPDNGCSISLICPPDVDIVAGTPVNLQVRIYSVYSVSGINWEVTEAPPGAASTLIQWTPNPATSISETFVTSSAGRYTIRVTVTDSRSNKATCDTHVTGNDRGLRVDLFSSKISFLSLHLHNSEQRPWYDNVYMTDCFFGSNNPNWGDAGQSDNPILYAVDRSVVYGLGPDIIHIETPNVGETYTIGVHNLEGAGSIATVRIFCGNVSAPTAVYVSRPLVGTANGWCSLNDFWKVAKVVFAPSGSCIITTVDSYSTAADRCISF